MNKNCSQCPKVFHLKIQKYVLFLTPKKTPPQKRFFLVKFKPKVTTLGVEVGCSDGFEKGAFVGFQVGPNVGSELGSTEGKSVGLRVGVLEGEDVGEENKGNFVGLGVGSLVKGLSVGLLVTGVSVGGNV